MNYDFGKLDENRMMRYAPDSVRVIEHHTAQHEEYDSYDEEGNPVGEPHMVTDEWTTERVVLHPNADDYRNAKDGPYLPNERTPANPPEGMMVATDDWDTDGEKNFKVYTYEPIPDPKPVVKVYNKYRLGLAIEEAGLLPSLLEYFAANPTAQFHWDNANDFESGDDNFDRLVGIFKATYGDEAVDAILAKAEV